MSLFLSILLLCTCLFGVFTDSSSALVMVKEADMCAFSVKQKPNTALADWIHYLSQDCICWLKQCQVEKIFHMMLIAESLLCISHVPQVSLSSVKGTDLDVISMSLVLLP
ncbi:hypothetical protein GOODEAATRI_015530 [Goodea atripinnis]|uniref:Secreted protein n=1 Tax=Goodea atripinnis TaxID=208336 RepID=A0ABV0MSF0_9TELE